MTQNTAILSVVVNQPPIASTISLGAMLDSTPILTITEAELLSGVTDPEGDLMTVANVAISSGTGSIVPNGVGVWDYTPAGGASAVVFGYDIVSNGNTIQNDATLSVAASVQLNITNLPVPTVTVRRFDPHVDRNLVELVDTSIGIAGLSCSGGYSITHVIVRASLRTELQISVTPDFIIGGPDFTCTYTAANATPGGELRADDGTPFPDGTFTVQNNA